VLGLPDDVGVLYYGVDTRRYRPFSAGESLAARTGLGIRADDRVVLYVARMVEEMGLGDLLSAVPDLLAREPRTRVLVAGATGSLTPRAHALAAGLPAGRLSVHESVPDDVLPQLYAAADVVAAPSNNERACLGLAIAEAMATERPVVACAVGGTAEVVVDGETGTLVPPNAPEALAKALLTYLENPKLAARHGAAGRSRAVDLFDVEAANARVEELFLAVMERHGRRFQFV
jgi:phosphatidylinositol alpha-1,6-mannosyltransferase